MPSLLDKTQFVGDASHQEWAGFLTDKLGFSGPQAAGILANLVHESGDKLNPKAEGDSGTAHGVAQWRLDRYDRARRLGFDVKTTQGSMDYLEWELNNDPAFMRAADRVRATNDPAQAATIWNKFFEKSADRTGGREALAVKLAQRFTDGSSTAQRLDDGQAEQIEPVVDVTSKLAPNGIPWEQYRKSKNVEDFRQNLEALRDNQPELVKELIKRRLANNFPGEAQVGYYPDPIAPELASQAGIADLQRLIDETDAKLLREFADKEFKK